MSSDNKFVRSLIESAKHGNNAAIDQLFQMNLGKVYAVALRLTANKPLAESITQDTFIEAWKKMSVVRSDAAFLKWLIAITVYQTLISLRSENRKITINHKELSELESKDELDKYIVALPDMERMVFVLHRIEGYSIDEISDMMGIKKDEVNNYLSNARSKLIDELPSLSDDEVMNEKVSKVIPELQPSKEVKVAISGYIMDEKIREQKEQERLAAQKAEKERLENPPVDFPEIKEEIKEEKVKPKKKISINFDLIKKFVYGILGLAVIVAGYIFLTSSGGWEIISVSGQPKEGSVVLKKDDGFKSERTITTDQNSSISFLIPDIGRLLIEGSSSVSRTKNTNEIKVNYGDIKKFEGNASDILTVLTPLAKIKELYKGSAFKLIVDDLGNSKLIVESGWEVINIDGFESYVPKNFDCQISKGRYAIPYPSDSKPQLISLIQNFNGVNDPALGTILTLATKKDALSLWHIIQLISNENRFIAFDKLNELIPVPQGVTKAGIIALNKDMLLDWRREIELKMD